MEFVRNLESKKYFQHIYIYGAGIVAASVYTALWKQHGIRTEKFVVSSAAGNPDEIDGVSVVTLDEVKGGISGIFWIIAAPKVHHADVRDVLLKRGADNENMLFVDSGFENRLMESYFKSKGYVTQSDFGEGIPTMHDEKRHDEKRHDEKRIEVYQVKCHMDRPLLHAGKIPQYIKPIQAGTALTKQRIAPLSDSMYEDNISSKNGNYCELTATYHVWKHSDADYKGICHYRRIFDLNEETLHNIFRSGADVILPYPTVHYPNIKEQHCRYISDSDWDAMLRAVEEVEPEYGADFKRIFSEQFFYNFNMLVARREVFDDYCRVLFGILKKTEELASPKGWERSDRFAGYMGENLTTLYFMANKDRLKIIHAGKIWLT